MADPASLAIAAAFTAAAISTAGGAAVLSRWMNRTDPETEGEDPVPPGGGAHYTACPGADALVTPAVDPTRGALWLAEAVTCAYRRAEGDTCMPAGVTHVGDIVDPRMQFAGGGSWASRLGFVARDNAVPSAHYVIFRGSTGVSNWLANFATDQVPFPGVPGALVHHGFLDALTDASPLPVFVNGGDDSVADRGSAYFQVRQHIFTSLAGAHLFPSLEGAAETGGPGHPPVAPSIYFAGHSLGGALAQMAAAYMARHDAGTHLQATTALTYARLHCQVFGTPRVGNEAFARWLPTRLDTLLLHINLEDEIPHLPLSVVPGTLVCAARVYSHAGPAGGGAFSCFSLQRGGPRLNHSIITYRDVLVAPPGRNYLSDLSENDDGGEGGAGGVHMDTVSSFSTSTAPPI